MDGGQHGQTPDMDEHRETGGPADPDTEQHDGEPEVVATLDGDVSSITVRGAVHAWQEQSPPLDVYRSAWSRYSLVATRG